MNNLDRLVPFLAVVVAAFLCVDAFVWHDYLPAVVLAVVWAAAFGTYYRHRSEQRDATRRV
jgi:membrane associated rhomboid family serine protease